MYSGMNPLLFKILTIFSLLFIAVTFIVAIAAIFSPKFAAKLASRQMKTLKHMTDYSKEDLTDIHTNLAEAGFTGQKRILDQNEGIMTDIANQSAQIHSGAVETLARSARQGFTQTESVYCKHCGSVIDADSKFCKICGGQQ